MVSFKRVVATIAASALVAGSLAACSSAEDGPSVYFLNFKPEQDAIYQKIAAAYTEETGVPVKVVTAASGTYEQTLKAEVGKRNQPTLFQVNGIVGLKKWSKFTADLTDAMMGKYVPCLLRWKAMAFSTTRRSLINIAPWRVPKSLAQKRLRTLPH